MDGFKDSTKMKYMGGGMVGGYAKGGSAKAGAKIAKVMGEFKKGELHSGSKEGPKVKSPKQAMAIAMSEAGKAPMKKGGGGDVKMPSPAESAASGNRMAEMEAKEERMLMRRAPGVGSVTERDKREMKKRVPATRREPMLPPVGESVKSGNRMSAQEGAEARKMQTGGKVSPMDKYKQVQARLAQAKAEAQAAAMKRPMAAKSTPQAAIPSVAARIGSSLGGMGRSPGFVNPPSMMLGRNMPAPDYNQGTSSVDPRRAMGLKKGGLAVMPKGK